MINLEKPVRKDAFIRSQRRLIEFQKHRIPILVAFECWTCLSAYHGTPWNTLRYFFWWEFKLAVDRMRLLTAMRIADAVGWTHAVHYPATEEMIEHTQRHGKNCSRSLNCSDINCVSSSLPRWFKIIAKIEDI